MNTSPQFERGKFVNILPTIYSGVSFSAMKEFFFGGSAHRTPEAALPVLRRTKSDFSAAPEGLRVTWLGHSTILLELDGKRFLVDPVWGQQAAPSPLLGATRFFQPPLEIDALPEIDAVIISHDHYDHLDAPTIKLLSDRVPRFYVPLGVGSHLEYWGVDPSRITEFDWWDSVKLGAVEITSTPARHFSGRFVNDRDATLWSGWVFASGSGNGRLYYSGDTAMTPQFTEIGERLGPFDMTLIEAGAYNQAWADVHLGPEQAIEAHKMVGGGLFVPVHWGLFNLSLHGWTEPIERIRVAAEVAGIRVAYPRPGESITLDDVPTAAWWPEIPWDSAEEAPAISSGGPFY
jgi:L-ascorbate metabolism protein UlaG (beta-lactamase superfamily)